MRYGLLALSMAMLAGGGVAAQSALAISHSVSAPITATVRAAPGTLGEAYGSLPFTAARSQRAELAAR